MRNILLALLTLVFLGCASDDSSNGNSSGVASLVVDVGQFELDGVTINWTVSGGAGDVLYRIVLNDVVLEEAYSGTTYTFESPENQKVHLGVIYAISENGDDTFAEFRFNTHDSKIWYGDLNIQGQYLLDNINPNLEVVTGRLSIYESAEDLSNLSSLEGIKELRISSDIINDISALQNLSYFLTDTGVGEIYINMPNLTDAGALSNISSKVSILTLINANSLQDLTGFGVADGGMLKMRYSDISSFSGFSNATRVRNLSLYGLPNLTSLDGLNLFDEMGLVKLHVMNNLSSLDGLNQVTNIGEFWILNLPSIVDLQGLDNLAVIGDAFRIEYCDQLESLDGATLMSSTDSNPFIGIYSNQSLTDFCGLSNLLINLDGAADLWISNNAYNPSYSMIVSPTECRQ
ncbi:hypothetical protein J1N09_05715 [Aureitalea sp. L0-47]|uniref:hypothetical protein n=1 Tax=Aureitalea sp. L0-47 TaxID=2816962 RepID=UPI0022376F4D|nr:hypothetical protein [Aureitalea sp. L0-47]MCW5519326.1 hypothetical protein [Aureitalea sp. L0-47]